MGRNPVYIFIIPMGTKIWKAVGRVERADKQLANPPRLLSPEARCSLKALV